MSSFFKFLLILVLTWGFRSCHGRTFSFKMQHIYSEPVKKWAESRTGLRGFQLYDNWPVKSMDYYSQLAIRDRIFRGRRISEFGGPITFSDGNLTCRITALGFLHYTTVTLGTPGLKFLVALDTGSDLFWVPCDCSKCAPTEGTSYSSDFELSIYNPKESSTSKKVSCNNSLCAHRSRCIGTFSNCPYMISYISAETSTSGILVEDLMHLKTDDTFEEEVQVFVTFGCGQVQTGSFLDVAAPNGLFGLGMEKISVPSILSEKGLTSDSFSMCFGSDGSGRISFGDKGSPDQEETPFNINPLHPTYNISVTRIRVGTNMINMEFTALFDSGTSFTYLADPFYKRLSDSFHSLVEDSRRPPDSRIPFEYCYHMSPGANNSLIPSMSLTMKGGGQFVVYDPIIVISTQNELVYCLAVVKSVELNIIGQNFMTGYRITFDREELILGWKKFDCYDTEDHGTFPTEPRSSTKVPPAFAAGLGNSTTTNSATEMRNSSQHSASSSSSYCCRLFKLISPCSSFLLSLFIFLVAAL